MSDNFGNTYHHGGIPKECPLFPESSQGSYRASEGNDANLYFSEFSAQRASNIKFPALTSLAGHHDHDKLGSITDSLDVIDSGLGSMSIGEAERQQQLDKLIEGDQTMCREESESTELEKLDSAYVPSIEEKNDQGVYASYIPSKDGYTDLHLAIIYQHKEQVISLIQDVEYSELLDFHTPDLHTALHLAVYHNQPEIVRFLVVYGANISCKDTKGNTPLHTACEAGRLLCARMLLSQLDKDENLGLQTGVPQDINEKNYEGLTCLHLATINHHKDLVSFLLGQRSINVNAPDGTSGRTALHHAIERRNLASFSLLLQKSANVNATTWDGCSPLHLAVGMGLEDETRSLMTRGANVDCRTHDDTRIWDLAKTRELKDALHYSMMQMTRMSVRQR